MKVERCAVLVGYDGSADSQHALAWATGAARRHSRVLQVLVATGEMWGAAPHDRWLRYGDASRLAAEASELAAGYEVDAVAAPCVAEDGAGHALVAASKSAAMVVVGARGRSWTTRVLVGSVSRHLAHRASCTVVVVRPTLDPGDAHVVVGVRDSTSSQPALAFAVEEAWLGGAAVDALHACAEKTAGEEILRVALDGWPDKYPALAVTACAVVERPVRALVAASQHAALLVVAHREPRSAVPSPTSVEHGLLHHARCPVAFVRDGFD